MITTHTHPTDTHSASIVGRLRSAVPMTIVAVTLMCAATFVSGCASYVNIPPDDEDTAFHSVNMTPVPRVMEQSLEFAARAYPSRTSSPAVMIPKGANESAIARCVSAVAGTGLSGASAWQSAGDSRPAYRVLSVRIRGSNAIVEVLLPPSSAILDSRRLLELNLHGDLGGWKVESARRFYATDERISRGAEPAAPMIDANGEPAGDSDPAMINESGDDEFIDLDGPVTPDEGRLLLPEDEESSDG